MFAVIDIETTGGRPDRDRITEIAILLHDGEKVLDRFCTLINPECRIPVEIQRLTGISNEMVENAPRFYEVAKQIVQFTENAVFVAHNVRFDYGFIRAAFRELGYLYQRETLCTVRLSRQVFRGLPSYSLGRLCESLNITLKDRHRAQGDAEATAILLGMILRQKENEDPSWVTQERKKTSLPPLLKEDDYRSIPEGITGVYYFHDSDGHVLYVGKALDIRKRISQHFAIGGKDSKKSMQMKSQIAGITYQDTGSELIALLLESDEIKKIKPVYNVMQKRSRAIPYYGIFSEYDAFGYVNLHIRKLKDGDEPIYTADKLSEARNFLQGLMQKHRLCQSKCDLHHLPGPCFYFHIHQCSGACTQNEEPASYNERALEAIASNSFRRDSFLIIGKGRNPEENSLICIEKGQYKGFGFVDSSAGPHPVQILRQSIKPYPHNRDIQQILCTHLKREHQKIRYSPEELSKEETL